VCNNDHMSNHTDSTVKFTKTSECQYEVHDDGILIGTVRKTQDSVPVCAPGYRYSYATTVSTRWHFSIANIHTAVCPNYDDRNSVGYSFPSLQKAADSMAGRVHSRYAQAGTTADEALSA
jgi:hypothetical protein